MLSILETVLQMSSSATHTGACHAQYRGNGGVVTSAVGVAVEVVFRSFD